MTTQNKRRLREFRPVPEEDRAGLRPEKASQSMLAQYENCKRAGYLYLRYGGGVQTHAMARGTAFHEFAERATKHMLGEGEPRLPHDVAVTLMEEVIRDNKDLTFPQSDRKALFAMANNWAKAMLIDPSTVVSVERMAQVLLPNGWVIRGKLDLLERVEDAAGITDYKTSLSVPSQEKFERGFQGPFYALLAMRGTYEDTGEPVIPNAVSEITEVYFAEKYPRYFSDFNESMSSRSMVFGVPDLIEFEAGLVQMTDELEEALEATGDFPATPGNHCAFCPAQHECPIPTEFRTLDSVTDPDEARMAWDKATVLESEVRKLKASVREFVKATEEPLPISDDIELGFKLVESEVIQDKDALRAFIEQTQGADPDQFYTKRSSTRFGEQKRKAE